MKNLMTPNITLAIVLTKRIPLSRSAAADLCGSILGWTRDGWWFRAWLGRMGWSEVLGFRRAAHRR